MPTQAFAVYHDATGPLDEVLRLGNLEIADPAPGEVLVELLATGLNPADVKRIAGSAPVPFGHRLVPGDDGAGIITKVGTGVSEKRLGQRVWLYMSRFARDFGTAATHVVLPAERAVPLPEGVSFEAGACLGVPAITAWQALLIDGDIAGQTVLIHGGAGAVGSAAVQLAVWAGARVIATVSGEEKAAVAAAAGATHVLNYRTEDVAERVLALTGGQGVDRVVDVALGANVQTNLKVLKNNGVIAAYASDGDSEPRLPVLQLLRKNITVHFQIIYTLPESALRHAVRDISAALATGALAPIIRHQFPLQNFAEADRIVSRLSGIGNVVLIPGTSP